MAHRNQGGWNEIQLGLPEGISELEAALLAEELPWKWLICRQTHTLGVLPPSAPVPLAALTNSIALALSAVVF